MGSHRLVRDQLPGGTHSLSRQLFEDVNADFNDPSRTIEVTAADGTKTQVPRKDRFGQPDPYRVLIEEANRLGAWWPPLTVGLFGGSLERINDIATAYHERLLKSLPWF